MIKIKKIGIDGKEHEYFQYTPEEIEELKKRHEDRMKKIEEKNK